MQRTEVTEKSEVLKGTLDLMILKTLHAPRLQHGFGIASRIEQVSEDVLTLNEGTLCDLSENTRKARYYSIASGLKQLTIEIENWERTSGLIARVLSLQGER